MFPLMKDVMNSDANKHLLHKNTMKAAQNEGLLFTKEEFEKALESGLQTGSEMANTPMTSPEPLATVNLFVLEKVLHDLRVLSTPRLHNPLQVQAAEETVRIVRRRETTVQDRTVRPHEDDFNAFSVPTKRQTPRSLLGYRE
jgi:hypothetical protein